MNNIDFVITWVDGNDEKWLQEKQKYSPSVGSDDRESRYREWDLLRYWFRGIESCAPWVRKIFFVTYGHLPKWLNTNNPKLVIIKHEDFIPEEYLPTFSCRPIEFNLHRITGLSQNFVYFNDDMFLLSPVKEKDFFKRGLPCDSAILNTYYYGGIDNNSGLNLLPNELHLAPIFNVYAINNNFSKNQSIRKNVYKWFAPQYGFSSFRTLLLLPWKSFPGFMSYHLPYSYNKDTFIEVWEKNFDLVHAACLHKFRDNTDVSSWLLSFWQIAEGRFYPRSPRIGQQFNITNNESNNQVLYNHIVDRKTKIVCINDSIDNCDYSYTKKRLHKAFETVFPEKSSFEL